MCSNCLSPFSASMIFIWIRTGYFLANALGEDLQDPVDEEDDPEEDAHDEAILEEHEGQEHDDAERGDHCVPDCHPGVHIENLASEEANETHLEEVIQHFAADQSADSDGTLFEGVACYHDHEVEETE